MSVFHESGVSVTLTDLDHHRFCDLPTYKSINGDFVKEVDYCWLQSEAFGYIKENTLIGLELKGYEHIDSSYR
jgi:hypothetical protein